MSYNDLPFGPGYFFSEFDEEDDYDEDYMGELVRVIPCEKCIYRETEACKWRKDEEPFGTDYCSEGTLKPKE